jgi:hypothetical protein
MLNRTLIALALILTAAGCASDRERAAAAAARQACEGQHFTTQAELSACIAQLEDNVRQARQYEPPQRGRPPQR